MKSRLATCLSEHPSLKVENGVVLDVEGWYGYIGGHVCTVLHVASNSLANGINGCEGFQPHIVGWVVTSTDPQALNAASTCVEVGRPGGHVRPGGV